MAKKMMNSITAAVALGLLLAPANAEIAWDTTHGKSPARRLATSDEVNMAYSHTDTSDKDCIVGGYDPLYPTKIYVGGPCSLIDNGKPKEGFRYIVLETLDASLAITQGSTVSEVETVPYDRYDAKFQYSANTSDYAEVGAGLTVHFKKPDYQHASLFLSTTSYLAKANFGFTKNSFVIGVDLNTEPYTKEFISDVCVKPCPGTKPVTCTSCPTENITVTKGQFKYSVLAAAWNFLPMGLRGGVIQGWPSVVNAYGTVSGPAVGASPPPKTLSGYLNVYQWLDFTNMRADRFTIYQAPDDTELLFEKMETCNLTSWKSWENASKDCEFYSVKRLEVSSDKWAGGLALPLTYNVGSWSQADRKAAVVPAMEGTRTVVIKAVRPHIQAMPPYVDKAVLLEYKFDVSGITADALDGKYMVYDPTIRSVKTFEQKSDAGETSAGRIACGPAVAFFTTTFLVALGGFM